MGTKGVQSSLMGSGFHDGNAFPLVPSGNPWGFVPGWITGGYRR